MTTGLWSAKKFHCKGEILSLFSVVQALLVTPFLAVSYKGLPSHLMTISVSSHIEIRINSSNSCKMN